MNTWYINLIALIQNENKLFTIAMIGFSSILVLLIINLFKVHNLKKKVVLLERQLKKSK